MKFSESFYLIAAIAVLTAVGLTVAGEPANAQATTARAAIIAPSRESTEEEAFETAQPRSETSQADAAAAAARSSALSVRTLRGLLDTFGIPFDEVTTQEELADYPVAYLSGGFYNDILETGWSNALYRYVERGGVLVAPSSIGSSLYPLFGVSDAQPSKSRYRLEFNTDVPHPDPALSYIDHENEKVISLGNGPEHIYDEVIWTHGYETSPEAEALAEFDDGSAGVVRNYFGRGMTYLLGFSWVESIMLPRVGHDFEAQRAFVNSVEPSADVVLLFAKAVYESNAYPAVYLHTIPDAARTALILSHDVDAQTSFVDSLKFARLAESFDASATFFENTKYFSDWKDIDYYNVEENKEAIRELAKRGFDIGSHTVSHYTQLDTAPLGDPEVTYAEYAPTEEVTLYGEVRVSKELLDRDIPGQETVSFRAGDLAFHDGLIGVLDDAGYLYDSTFSANDVLTSFPFFAARKRVPFSKLSSVIEIPLTLDDSLGFLTPDTVDTAVDTWIEVLEAHAANESITVLLNHPSDTRDADYKLRAQERLMERAEELGAWMGDLTSFGEFWRSRHNTDVSVELGENSREELSEESGPLTIRIDTPYAQIHPALSIVVGNVPSERSIVLEDAQGSELSYTKRSAPGETKNSSFVYLVDIGLAGRNETAPMR